MYLSHVLLTLPVQYQRRFPPPVKHEAITFMDFVQQLRQVACDVFLQMMRIQKDQILEILKQSGSKSLHIRCRTLTNKLTAFEVGVYEDTFS